MKVVLLSRVDGLGEAGDMVDVANGYARNALFPSGLAAAATSGKVREAAARKGREAKMSNEELARTQRLAEFLDGKSVTIRVPVGPQGKLHGSVTADGIVRELSTSVRRLPPGVHARLPKPLHEPGEQKVTLELPHGLEATISVIVEGLSPDEEHA